MPRVPTYDNFQVQQNTLPSAKFTPIANIEQPAAGIKQMQQVGKSLEETGNNLAAVEADALDQANALRVADSKNKLKELQFSLQYDKSMGYTNLRGVDALQRPDGKPLADEYAEKFQDGIGKITDGLGNDAQKKAFSQYAGGALAEFHGQAMAHEGEQFRTYAGSVHEGTIKNAMNDIGINYNNPEVINQSISEIKAAAYEAAKLQNKSAVYAEAQARDLTSKAHLTALESAIQKNDPSYADAYLKKYSKDMNADDILKADGVLTKQLDGKIALETADKVIQQYAPKISTSNGDRAFNIAVGTESGGQQFGKDGQPLTSSAGAVGIAQVMPATGPEAAKLAGVAWDEEKFKNDADYNRALGKAYFDKQLKDFGGSLAQAYAAYNAGPARTKQALKDAKASSEDWVSFLPEETRNYVQKNMAAYESGGGRNAQPTLEDVKAQVRAEVGTSRPERLKLALESVTSRYEDMTKAIKQKDEANVANAMREVIANGGRYSELAPDLRASLPPGEVGKVMDFAQKVAKGDDTTNPALYQKLSSPGALGSLSDDQFFSLRRELSESDFKHFSNERAQALSGKATNGPGELNTGAIKSTLDDRLRTMGLDPTPKDGSGDAMRVGAIRKFVNDSIAVAQTNSGKKMTDTEVSQHIDSLIAKNATYSKFFGDSSGPMLGMSIGNVPGSAKNALKEAFKKQGIDDPTDGQLLDAYWRGLTKAKPPAGKQIAGK